MPLSPAPMPYCLAVWPEKPSELPRLAVIENEDALATLLTAGWTLKNALEALEAADKGTLVRVGERGFLWLEDAR